MDANKTIQDFRHLPDIFFFNSIRRADGLALAQCGHDGTLSAKLTWKELWGRMLRVRHGLQRSGFSPGSRAAIWCRNRMEWLQIDVGIQLCGGIGVPVYTTLAPEEVTYILEHCGAEILFVDTADQFERLRALESRLGRVRTVVVLGSDVVPAQSSTETARRFLNWREFIALDENYVAEKAAECLDGVDPAAAVTCIYTSGTTGFPKGVLLTHGNFLANLRGVAKGLLISAADRHLSFLPLSHVFERLCGHYLLAYAGGSIAYARSFETVADDARIFRPTFLMSVPRFYEKFQSTVVSGVRKKGGLSAALFAWAEAYGDRKILRTGVSDPGYWLALKQKIAHTLVRRKLKAVFGGRIRFLVSGGAALPKEIGEYFTRLGLLMIEGYGLTETSPVITMNRVNNYRLGSVGQAIDGVEMRISPDGEIQTRGASVMKGYLGDPTATAAAIRDGWFCTGDMGSVDSDGFLTITGRFKEIIVLSGGKKLSPRLIEERVESQPGIRRCVVYGDGKNFLTALILPSEEDVAAVTQTHGLEIRDPNLYSRIQERVNAANAHFAPFEQIKYFVILARDFTVESGELTPTLKLRRKVIAQKYGELLEPYYKKAAR